MQSATQCTAAGQPMAVIGVHDAVGNLIETHGHKGRLQRMVSFRFFVFRLRAGLL